LTPSKKLVGNTLKKTSDQQRSQKIIVKHKPSNSYGGSSISEKKLEVIKNTIRPSSTHTSERKSKEVHKKLIVHKKANSISERPLNLIMASLQGNHKHKISLDKRNNSNVVSTYAYRSNTGFIPGNPNKINQDSFIIKTDLNFDSQLFAVADGHGLNGEFVSGCIRESYPILLISNPYFLSNPNRAILASAAKLNKSICNKDFDTNFSGSTFISVLLRGLKLWCANVGDSRALLGRQLADKSAANSACPGKASSNHWMSIALSRDHKPNEPDESARIHIHGGRVEAYQDEHGNPFGPCRVWLKTQNIPGLAMSRSFGDKVAASVGVICEPEILEFDLTSDDKFIVIGSDGIFEFLNNEDIVKLVVPYWRRGDVEGAAEALAKEAKATWMKVGDI
jgi:serine/threonine protein phosphatase PrpC